MHSWRAQEKLYAHLCLYYSGSDCETELLSSKREAEDISREAESGKSCEVTHVHLQLGLRKGGIKIYGLVGRVHLSCSENVRVKSLSVDQIS
jgi:hypothetical protein